LYVPGYGLDGSINDRWLRLASGLLELYRNFSLHEAQKEISPSGIDTDAFITEIRSILHQEVASAVFRHNMTDGADAKVFISEDKGVFAGEPVIIKGLVNRYKDTVRMPDTYDGPLVPYEIAEKYQGHLVARYAILHDLTLQVRASDGSIHEEFFKSALIQKYVHEFFKQKMWDPSIKERRCEGVLAEAIQAGDLQRAKMMIVQFFWAVRANMLRGLTDWDVKAENYGYDPSMGEVAALDLSKAVRWQDVTREMARIFIRNLQETRNQVYCFARATQGAEAACQMRTYFETACRVMLRIPDWDTIDITPDPDEDEGTDSRVLRRIEDDIDDLEQFMRELSAQTMRGLPVCYAGPARLRMAAAEELADFLYESRVDIDRAEQILAARAFRRSSEQFDMARWYPDTFIAGNLAYMNEADEVFVGAKVIAQHADSTGTSYDALDAADQPRAACEAVKALLRFYMPQQDLYNATAKHFDLPAVDVSDRLALLNALRRIPFENLLPEDMIFLNAVWCINSKVIQSADMIFAFDHVREYRLFPKSVYKKDFFFIRDRDGVLHAKIVAFTSGVRKVLEADVLKTLGFGMREVRRPQERFRVDAALLRQALVEFFGPSGAATFLLKAYYQLDASDGELKEMILKKIEKIRDNDTERVSTTQMAGVVGKAVLFGALLLSLAFAVPEAQASGISDGAFSMAMAGILGGVMVRRKENRNSPADMFTMSLPADLKDIPAFQKADIGALTAALETQWSDGADCHDRAVSGPIVLKNGSCGLAACVIDGGRGAWTAYVLAREVIGLLRREAVRVDGEAMEKAVRRALTRAHRLVSSKTNKTSAGLAGMMVVGRRAVIFSSGDLLAVVAHNGEIIHQADRHSKKSFLQSLKIARLDRKQRVRSFDPGYWHGFGGMGVLSLSPDIRTFDLPPGSVVLLASDGILDRHGFHGMAKREILTLMNDRSLSAADILKARMRSLGSKVEDDKTVMLYRHSLTSEDRKNVVVGNSGDEGSPLGKERL